MSFVELILSSFLDYLFPRFCLGCSLEGTWVCRNCEDSIALLGVFACPICHRFREQGECCPECRPKSALSSHLAIVPYHDDTLIGQMIQHFKYRYVEDLEETLDHCMIEFFCRGRSRTLVADLIVPVPLHPRRYAERGFNQAERIANQLGRFLVIPVFSLLTRSRSTAQQARLSRDERKKNVVNAFRCKKPEQVKGKIILLVDDVFTTGSTLQECAQALREAGAVNVSSFSIARG